MSQAINTVDTLNGQFKEVYADKIRDLVPDGVKLFNMVDFNSADKQPGNYYHAPVILGLEQGVTYGGAAGDAFLLNSAVASANADAQVRGCEMVLVSAISVGAAARSVSSKNAFIQETKQLVQNMLKSMHIRLESQLFYGQMGIAKIASVGVDSVTVCAAEWAPGIWAGAKNMIVEIRSQAGTLRGTATVANVNLDSLVITLDMVPAGTSGNADPNNSASDVIWYKGAYGKEFAGLQKIITNTGSLFNIDAAQYDLWKGNVIDVGTDATTNAAFISFEKLEEACAKAMEKGLMEEEVTAMVHPKQWNKLMTDLAAKRMYDSSYSEKEMKQGSKSIKLYGQTGVIEVVSSLFVKQGYAFVVPTKELSRVGSTEVTFEQPGMEGKFFRLLDSKNGYELRLYTDQALFTSAPGLFSLLRFIKVA
jgi:hypothetical protein